MITRYLKTVEVRGERVDLRVVSDDHPDYLRCARALWERVYGWELSLLAHAATDAALDALLLPGRGAYVILAMVGDECVGTIRMAYQDRSPDEVEFAMSAPQARLGALSRLVLHRRMRRTSLSLHLLEQTYVFNRETGHDQRYDEIVVTCEPPLLPYYYTFGFERLSPDIIRHPALRTGGVLVACSKATNERVVGEISRHLAGARLVQARWAMRYQMHKLRTRFTERSFARAG
jgi:hypothetical protein